MTKPSLRSTETMATLLGYIGAELGSLAQAVFEVQATLGPVLAAVPSLTMDAMLEAQRLDLIEQTLWALTDVVSKAAGSKAASLPLDLRRMADGCTLADLANRLRGIETEAQDDDLQLF